ncbi:MAG: hypothetical protein IPM91_02285 [Bacteroidetes bacterium]|nr:hypothetical protein [Bacteroidota bacterium]
MPVFSKLTYKNVYANIDWIIYISEDNVKYDFVVHPGGDPKQIKILYKNNKDLHLNENGDLVVSIYNSTLVEKAPVSFQDGRNISTKFALVGDTLIFNIEKYNSNSKLIIDPSIEWATFFGGNSDDFTLSLTTDNYDNAIFVGYTISATTYYTNVFQTVYGGGITDAFITKFDPFRKSTFFNILWRY